MTRYTMTDENAVKALIRQHPWATLVGTGQDGLVAAHYPVLLDEDSDGIVLLSHVSRRDADLFELGAHELLVIFSGPHGYISPGWYQLPVAVPTWNFAVVHAYGVPKHLDTTENLNVLERLVDRFEDALPKPFRLNITEANTAYAQQIVGGTVGYAMRVDRVVARDKMSQDKPAEVVDRIVAELRSPGPYQNLELANRVAAHRGH